MLHEALHHCEIKLLLIVSFDSYLATSLTKIDVHFYRVDLHDCGGQWLKSSYSNIFLFLYHSDGILVALLGLVGLFDTCTVGLTYITCFYRKYFNGTLTHSLTMGSTNATSILPI